MDIAVLLIISGKSPWKTCLNDTKMLSYATMRRWFTFLPDLGGHKISILFGVRYLVMFMPQDEILFLKPIIQKGDFWKLVVLSWSYSMSWKGMVFVNLIVQIKLWTAFSRNCMEASQWKQEQGSWKNKPLAILCLNGLWVFRYLLSSLKEVLHNCLWIKYSEEQCIVLTFERPRYFAAPFRAKNAKFRLKK